MNLNRQKIRTYFKRRKQEDGQNGEQARRITFKKSTKFQTEFLVLKKDATFSKGGSCLYVCNGSFYNSL